MAPHARRRAVQDLVDSIDACERAAYYDRCAGIIVVILRVVVVVVAVGCCCCCFCSGYPIRVVLLLLLLRALYSPQNGYYSSNIRGTLLGVIFGGKR